MIISIIGIDGAGKTTVAKKVVEELRNMGKPAKYIKIFPFNQGYKHFKPESYPMQDEPERKSHAANILSNNLSLSNCTFLAISLSVHLFAFLSNISNVTLSY
ncbi:hypothetical protein ES707_15994 [subsurface metagenome]